MSSWGWNLSPVDASLGTPLGKPAREEISLGKAKPGVGKLVTSEQESNTGTLSWEDPSLRVELPNPIQISVGNNSRTLPPQTMHCCCCLDESSRHHPGLFFPHPPFQALFRGPGRCCSSQLGALGKNFPSTFPVPGKNTEGSRREVSLKPAGSTRGGYLGMWLQGGNASSSSLSPEGQSWDPVGCSGSTHGSVGWLGSQNLAWKPGWGRQYPCAFQE